MKKAIVLVTFGTSVPEAQKAYERIERRARESFAAMEIRWAYSSRTIRTKLTNQGTHLDSPEVALARLMAENYTHVAVLSLHTIPGIEFHQLYRNAMLFGEMSGGFERIVVARPLLASQADMERVTRALLRTIPRQRKSSDAVIFMGHGSKNHPSDALYAAMNYAFLDIAENVYVATVQGFPTLDALLPKLVAGRVGKVFLLPFMSVAGEHVRNDMAGDKADSWKSVLMKQGFECEISLVGTAEYPEIVEIWLDHLREAISKL